jgi:hypothetical protein
MIDKGMIKNQIVSEDQGFSCFSNFKKKFVNLQS